MTRSHKIRLVPSKQQEVLLRKTCGTVRYVYNWALTEWQIMWKAYKDSGKTTARPSAYTLSKRWTLERPEWSRDVVRYPQTAAILNLGTAYLNFWNGKAKPPSRKRKRDNVAFTLGNTSCVCDGMRIYLQGLGWVRTREELRFEGKVMSYAVSHQAEQWYVSVSVEMPDVPKPDNGSVVGIDVGIAALAVCSDGTTCDNPLNLRKKQKYLAKLQRRMARQVKGSKRRTRAKARLARTHLRIVNIRQDAIHKFTSAVAKNHGTAVIETLDIKQMAEEGAKHLRRSLHDTAMREVHRQLDYKMAAVIRAPRYFPSSKRCNACGSVKSTFPCSIRVYKCERCGMAEGRDRNAAYNLKNMPWVAGSMHAKSARAEMQREAVNPGAS